MIPFKGSPVDFTGKSIQDLVQFIMSTSSMGSQGQRPENLDRNIADSRALLERQATQEQQLQQFQADQAMGQGRGSPTDNSKKETQGGQTMAGTVNFGDDMVQPGGFDMNPAQRSHMAYQQMMDSRRRQEDSDEMKATEDNAKKQQLQTYLSFLNDALLQSRNPTGKVQRNYNIG